VGWRLEKFRIPESAVATIRSAGAAAQNSQRWHRNLIFSLPVGELIGATLLCSHRFLPCRALKSNNQFLIDTDWEQMGVVCLKLKLKFS